MTRLPNVSNPYARIFGDYLHFVRTSVFRESLREFGKRVNLSPGYLGRLEQGVVGVPRRETVIQLAEGTGQVVDPWLNKAGYAQEGDPQNADFQYIALKLRRLRQEQVELVTDIIDTMAAKNERKEKRS